MMTRQKAKEILKSHLRSGAWTYTQLQKALEGGSVYQPTPYVPKGSSSLDLPLLRSTLEDMYWESNGLR